MQSGFGRTGSHYWGFESHGVIPDIGKLILLSLMVRCLILFVVTLAKGIGNGYPLGAIVTTPGMQYNDERQLPDAIVDTVLLIVCHAFLVIV